MIKDIKVWKNPTKTESRIYVHTDDGREGCLYLTGNGWHKRGEVEGQLTGAEWQEARELSIRDGKWHTVYNDQPLTSVSTSPKSRNNKTNIYKPTLNRKPGHCQLCGKYLEPGQAELIHYTDEEDIDFLGGGRAWVCYCLDKDACKSRREQAKAEERAAKDHERALKLEADGLADAVATETNLAEQQDWSWDDYRFSLGEVLNESEHYTAREYKDGGTVIGFTVKKK